MANNDTMKCTGMIKNLRLRLDYHKTSSNLYEIPMIGAAVIMRVWLKTLGKLCMHYGSMLLKLEKDQQLITKKGFKLLCPVQYNEQVLWPPSFCYSNP